MASKLTKFGLCLVLAAVLAACDSQTPQQKVEALRAAAAEHMAAGKHQAAVIELKNAVQLRPDAAELRRELGQLYLQLGDPVSALKELERAATLGLDTPGLRVERARAYLLREDHAAVLALVPPLAAGTPLPGGAAAVSYAMRARALADDGQLKAAVDLALRVLNTQDHPDARLALAAVAAKRGDGRNVVAHAKAALAGRPDDIDGLWLLAVGQTTSGANAQARETLKRMREQLWRPIRADLLMIRLALNAGDADEAWQTLDALEKTAGRHPEVQLYVATAALRRGNYEKARSVAETLLGRYPGVAQASYVAGAANLELGNFVLARNQLESYLRAQPDDARVRSMLARAERAAERMVAERDDMINDLVAPADGAQARSQTPRARQVATIDESSLGDEGLQEPEGPAAERQRARIVEILELVQRQEFDAARRAIGEMQARSPGSELARELEAIVMWNAGERSQAVAAMDALHRVEPASIARTTNLAQMHRSMGVPEAALAAIERARAAGAEDLRLNVEAARAHAALQDATGMEAELRAGLTLRPDNLRIRVLIGRLYLQQGRAQDLLDLSASAPAGAADHPDLLRLEAQAQMSLGDSEAAAARMRHLTEIQPDDPTAHQQLGQILLAAGRAGDAAAPLTTARLLSHNALRPSLLLAQALLASGAGEAAGSLLEELRTAHPQEASVHALAGAHALAFAGDGDAAEAAFRTALEIDPSEARLRELIQVQTRLGRHVGAIAEVTAWRKAHGRSERVEAMLGELYIGAGRTTDAVPLYRRLVARSPDNAAYRNNLAWLLMEQGALEAAQRQIAVALARAPDDPNILDTAGALALRRGDAAVAVRHLEKAAAAAPGNAEIQMNYVEALLSRDDGSAARAALAALDPAALPDRLAARFDALKQRSQRQP